MSKIDPKIKALEEAVKFNSQQMDRIETILLLSEEEYTPEEILEMLRKEIFGE